MDSTARWVGWAAGPNAVHPHNRATAAAPANPFRDTQPTLSAHISVMRWALLQQGSIMGAEWHRAVAQSYLGADGELPGDRPAGGQQLRGTDSAAQVCRYREGPGMSGLDGSFPHCGDPVGGPASGPESISNSGGLCGVGSRTTRWQGVLASQRTRHQAGQFCFAHGKKPTCTGDESALPG